MTPEEMSIDESLKRLPARPPDQALAERVRALGRRELAASRSPRARALPWAAAGVSLVYLAWALEFASALYR